MLVYQRVLPNHPFCFRISHDKPSSYWSIPMTMEPPINMYYVFPGPPTDPKDFRIGYHWFSVGLKPGSMVFCLGQVIENRTRRNSRNIGPEFGPWRSNSEVFFEGLNEYSLKDLWRKSEICLAKGDVEILGMWIPGPVETISHSGWGGSSHHCCTTSIARLCPP